MGQEPKARPLDWEPGVVGLHQGQRTSPRQQAGHMTEGRQPFTAEIKTLAKGPSTYDPWENTIRPERKSTAAARNTGFFAIAQLAAAAMLPLRGPHE